MDKLRIPPKWKNMIKSLSYKYSSTQRKDDVWSADFIQDKGEGQIFLLHGPSGVGKTYTAECVSELTGWCQSNVPSTDEKVSCEVD
jgi:putative ribosome biogenesis GTPase RsgA